MRYLEDETNRKEATNKSIEVRKRDSNKTASKKQAVTVSLQGQFLKPKAKTTYQNKHIKDDILDLEATAMFDKGIFDPNSRWIEDFIYNYLKEAKDNPESKPAERLASILFSENALNDIHSYIERQNAKDIEYYNYVIRNTLYDKQQEVFDDIIDQKHIIINSRRSGKTELMGRLLARNLLKPNSHCVYMNRNSSSAIRQIRKPLLSTLEKIPNLRLIKGSVEAQEMYFDNGSQLLILGNNNSADVDKLRGESISAMILDECGHMRNVRTLVREVIEPALLDYGKESKLYVVGTPPRVPKTFVEEIWKGDNGWKKWHWTFEDNPFIPDKETVIEGICKEHGVSRDSAYIQREYYGKMDAYDSEAVVFHNYKVYEELPVKGRDGIPLRVDCAYVGVDWGFEDKAAVVGVVASKKDRCAWVVKTWSEKHTSVSKTCEAVVDMVKYIKEKYKPECDVDIICDSNAKQDVYELIENYKLKNVKTAYKYDKDLAIELLAEWLRNDVVFVQKDCNDRLKEDLENTLWKRDEETDVLLHEIDDDVWHPNAVFALLYVSRQFDYDVLSTGYSKSARDVVENLLLQHGLYE